MVVSVIKPEEIKYNENRSIDNEDIDYSTLVYESELHDEEIEFVLGKEKHTYANKDITYFSIYLIHKNLKLFFFHPILSTFS